MMLVLFIFGAIVLTWAALRIMAVLTLGEPLNTIVYVLIVCAVIFFVVIPLLSRVSLPAFR